MNQKNVNTTLVVDVSPKTLHFFVGEWNVLFLYFANYGRNVILCYDGGSIKKNGMNDLTAGAGLKLALFIKSIDIVPEKYQSSSDTNMF